MYSKVRLLKERTNSELGVDTNKLPDNSNEKVFVQCINCSEIFKRKWINISRLHSCPTVINDTKICNGCKKYKEFNKFHKDETKPYNLTSWCKQCINEKIPGQEYPEVVELLNEVISRKDRLVRLECKLIHPDAKLPFQKRSSDVGHDLSSIENVVVPPHGMINVRTGIIVSCPPGWFLTIEGRSSLWKKGIMPSHGIIDATYCGELQVALFNYSGNPYEIQCGDRIAQIILQKVYAFDLVVVDDFGPDYNQRGDNGFGSTGR